MKLAEVEGLIIEVVGHMAALVAECLVLATGRGVEVGVGAGAGVRGVGEFFRYTTEILSPYQEKGEVLHT